jgi:peptidoglycan/xylan/chitin deacetylase (PgdA/CDA1 family)
VLVLGLTIFSSSKANATELVPNSSMESGTTTPTSWNNNTSGVNTSSFTWSTNGHTGSRSLRTNVTAFTSGDAKWWFNPVAVSPNTTYTYSYWSRSTVDSQLLVEFGNGTSNASVVWLATMPPSPGVWTQRTKTFTTLADTVTVTMYHALETVGVSEIDDASLPSAATPPPPVGQLVTNPSMEVGTTTPTSWSTGVFGVNTSTFTWSTNGHTGSRSLRTDITALTSGDAKWYFAPVTVSPSTSYTYSYWTRSTVVTQILAEYINAAGVSTVTWLENVPASPGIWTQRTKTLTTPSDAVRLSIYHAIPGVGTLETDDVSLTVNNTELLTNGTLELSAGAQPASWANSSFGVLTSSFSYPATGGHSGSRFVRTNVSAFSNGDAKWFPTSTAAVTAGSYYRFSDWYRTNTQTEVLAEVTLSGGATTYMVGSLPLASASAWTQYKTTWKMPPNATALRVWHSVVAVGFLETDDYSLMLQPNAPLTRPLISITVDDGNASDISYVLPKLQTTAMPATFFVVSSYLGTPNHTTAAQVVQLKNAGMEIGAHTVTHPDLATLSVAAQQTEIVNSKTTLQNVTGVPIVSFAAPFGHYTSQTLDIIRSNFTYHRSTGQNLNYRPTTNLYEIREKQIDPSTTAAQVSQWITEAVADNAWVVFMFHDVSTTPTATGTTPAVFDQMMNNIKNSGVTVKTMKGAAAEVAPQLVP